jgi:crotonobetainyl-CoA:carnitine CoA-transferase CaiB-like acyl-CoA transferase
MGTGHPSIVPYQMFEAQDGQMVVAVGNNTQFAKLCRALGLGGLAEDERFRTNPGRVKNREALVPQLAAAFAQKPIEYWIDTLTGQGVPCGPLNSISQVFEDPHVMARGTRVEVLHPRAGSVSMLANPARLSATPPSYDRAPPRLGEHTDEVLSEVLGLSGAEIAALREAEVV